MSDVIDELRQSYTERTSELSAVDVREALILAATEKGDVLRRVRRRRRSGVVALLVVVAVGATSVAIAARPDQRLRVGTTESTASSGPATTGAQEVCTQADLDEPGLAMPGPQRVTTSFSVMENLARIDPAPDAMPTVSAATAWTVLTRGQPVEASGVALVLGYYEALPGTAGPRGPVLAWDLRIQHLAYTGFQAGAAALPGTPTTQPPVCEFTNANLILDATTGTGIVDSYGP